MEQNKEDGRTRGGCPPSDSRGGQGSDTHTSICASRNRSGSGGSATGRGCGGARMMDDDAETWRGAAVPWRGLCEECEDRRGPCEGMLRDGGLDAFTKRGDGERGGREVPAAGRSESWIFAAGPTVCHNRAGEGHLSWMSSIKPLKKENWKNQAEFITKRS